MKNLERIVISALVVVILGGAYWGYKAVTDKRSDYRDRVAAGEFEIRDEPFDITGMSTEELQSEAVWRQLYPTTYPMIIGDAQVQASVADTLDDRILGLSNTPYLPDGVVKLFAFGVPGSHSIWMKDMNYALDIMWAAKDGTLVHIEENVSPDTYDATTPQGSKSFSSPVDAWFVVEANAGFVAQHGIERGDVMVLLSGG